LLLLPPLVMVMWANVHGGFPIGLLLIGCYAASSGVFLVAKFRLQALGWFLTLLVSILATLVNPYGWRVYEYVALTSSRASGRPIDEWLPPSLDMLTGKAWALSLLLLVIGLALSRRRLAWREICLLGCFLPLACGSVRMVAWWLLICTPMLAALLREAWPRIGHFDAEDTRPSLGNACSCSVILVGMLLSSPWLESHNPIFSRPQRAHRTETDLQGLADHLRSEGRVQRIFTRFDWGEYLGWSLAPYSTVFMDGRIEIIPDDVWQDYVAVTRGRADWEDILARYGVDCLVLDAGGYHHELLPQIERSQFWRQVHKQGDAVLFLRRECENLSNPIHGSR
jgi:hypothetical protein